MSVRILTVGDGDCSYSLALCRAFPSSITLTCTTLPDEAELFSTYSAAEKCLSELRERGARIMHGVDATALDRNSLGEFEHILFVHPHLGLSDLLDEAAHAHRHGVLVAHFLHSAAALLAPNGLIHLTLCGNQPSTWEVDAHAARIGLDIVQRAATGASSCFWPPDATPLTPTSECEAGWSARRKFRSGALGSRHWLGKYGYEHRRCEGDGDMNVDSSVELLFAVGPNGIQQAPSSNRTLAMPVLTPSEREYVDERSGKSFRTQFELESYKRQQANPQQQSKAVTDAAAKAAAAAAAASAAAASAAAAAIEGGDDGGSSFVRLQHVVPSDGDGSRAFAWTRKGAFATQLSSKKVAIQAFKEGRLLLNGAVVEETRILKEGDVLELLHDSGAAGRAYAAGRPQAPVILHEVHSEHAVVWNPAACRAAGDYPGTLQSALRTLMPPTMEPLPGGDDALASPLPISRLEVSCTGLTLVARTARSVATLNQLMQDGGVSHTFVALVYGVVPDEWHAEGGTTVRLPPPPPKRPKGKRRKAVGEEATAVEEKAGEEEQEDDEEDEEEDEPAVAAVSANANEDGSCLVGCSVLSVTSEGSPVQLTTIRLQSNGRRGRLCGDLCWYLRTNGYPVVGDRYAKRERGSLPRYCASLKAKPQFCCLGVKAAEVDIELSVPPRLMASSWSSAEAAKSAKRGAEEEVEEVA